MKCRYPVLCCFHLFVTILGTNCSEPEVNDFVLYVSNPQPVWYFNDSIEYSCAEGYRLIGNARLTCLSNTTWSSQAPQCEGKAKL